MQRAMRGGLQRARVAEGNAKFAPAVEEAAEALGAMPARAAPGRPAPGVQPPAQFRPGIGRPGRPGRPSPHPVAAAAADIARAGEELQAAGQTVRQVANRMFYRGASSGWIRW